MMQWRVGQGYDVHRLVEGRPLILGGVRIEHPLGLQGHSDADALLHAITDAVVGAAGLGDIGQLFPDTDARYQGADSAVLLCDAYARARAAGWRLVNVDSTVIAQAPRLAGHIAAMRARIAELLALDPECVNVKGKTNEKLGYLGRQEAIETQAVCLLARDI
jgi:2-C-methyl-D-erythritol 2,4-cyclodiphosphate synthase